MGIMLLSGANAYFLISQIPFHNRQELIDGREHPTPRPTHSSLIMIFLSIATHQLSITSHTIRLWGQIQKTHLRVEIASV